MSDSYESIGIAMTPGQKQRLDDMAAEWDEREVQSVGRSAVAREALELGLACLDVIDDQPELRRMHMRERRAWVRQCLLDDLRE